MLRDHAYAQAPPLIAIIGGGQLARMLGACALRLGLRVRCLAERPDDVAIDLGEVVLGKADSPSALDSLVRDASVVTFDHEWADPDQLAAALPNGPPIRPGTHTLHAIADKRRQRATLLRVGLLQPDFCEARNVETALAFANRHEADVVVKRPRGGYDGRGVALATGAEAIARAVRAMDTGDGVLVEARVPYVRELAVCVTRGLDGTTVVYPTVESVNVNERCEAVIVPARVRPDVAERATAAAIAAIEAFDCVGACTVELFELEDGRVMINEVSPRVHNTAHWTLEGANTSQFENHLRAILGWPLGDTGLRAAAAAMVNVFGMPDGVDPSSRLSEAMSSGAAAIHLYGKRDPRAGRKLGHVTAVGPDADDVLQQARRVASTLMGIHTGSTS
ncbi:MAG: 5-(carboxyamino)imidazole ribonucleotide synthase [Deltaproteobacteria bacterium]|nr:5-(carboxyamino)imidazole ribonucleotide synthase [Nannocystaceae bacterium]